MKRAGHRTHLAIVVVALAATGFHDHAYAAAQSATPGSPNVVKFSPNLTQSAVLARPDSDLVEFSDGKRMRVAELRRLDAWAKKARSTPGKPFPAALRAKPAPIGQAVPDAAALAKALKQPDNATLRLPSGRLATVGQIKLVLPKVEESVGHSLSVAPPQRNLSGPAVKVTAKSDWKDILKRPDGTVLEAPDGRRITVRELKQALQATKRAPGTSPQTPVAAPAGPARSPAAKQR
jgi:hypothetical protein